VNAASHPRSLGIWGVLDGYWDIFGSWRPSPPATVETILDAMGATEDGPPPPALITVRLDHPLPGVPAGTVVLEDGAEIDTCGTLPADLPPGYHALRRRDGDPLALVVSPGVVPSPPEETWGFSAQLYAVRSRTSWGMGDLSDLRRLGAWSRTLGAGVVLINPLHASAPTPHQQPSPYFAGSRCFDNPLYIAVEEVPGADAVDEVAAAASAGRLLNARRLIDRDRVWALKAAALDAIFARFEGDADFDRYRQRRAAPLERFATYCALAERNGPVWQEWPAGHRSPVNAAVRDFAASAEGSRRIRFHAWLQWHLDRQLSAAAGDVGVVRDLAVGVDPGGADSWIWQETFAPGMTVGAPADEFNTRGQDWALPPFDPWRLRRAGYEPWIEALRAGFRHGAGLRVDHVMGLFRLYWIPSGSSASEGVYVRYPHHDLLNILALEAHRAGAFVMGEDLGTVEDEVRWDLGERGILSYRLWWFEDGPTSEWPHQALGSLSTHDLPTVAGVLSGCDLEVQRKLGLQPNEESSAALKKKLLERTASSEETPVEDVIVGAYTDIAEAPCVIVSATLDDALAVEERPNVPGTVDEWPNWSIALPASFEELRVSPLARSIAAALSRDTADWL
jgi:4-alpha-glucanotransferase